MIRDRFGTTQDHKYSRHSAVHWKTHQIPMLRSNTPLAVQLARSPEAQQQDPSQRQGVTVGELMGRQRFVRPERVDTCIFYQKVAQSSKCESIYDHH
jgi:hypothetical protein